MQNNAHISVRQASPSWTKVLQAQLRTNFGAVMLAGIAMALCLFVAFIGVLQGAVERGESFRQQLRGGQSMGSSTDGSTRVNAAYSSRFNAAQQTLGASVAPALLFSAHGSR